MAVGNSTSFVLSSVLVVLIFSAMQIYKPLIISSQISTILGGFAGSWLFILSLTAVSNLEAIILGDGFQAKLFPEIAFCLLGSMFACGMVHRVAVTTCFIFSCLGLYFMHKISQRVHSISASVDVPIAKKKKK